MSHLRHILVVLPCSLQWTPALKKAVALGRALHAELWLALYDRGPRLGVLGLAGREHAQRLESMMRDQVSTRLQDLAKAVREDSGLTVHALDRLPPVEATHVAADVVQYEIDLVIKDVQHVSAIRRMLFVPLDWDLLRTCPVPLWLASDAKEELPMRIAAAVDPVHADHGTQLNPGILSLAEMIAKATDARLRVLTCFGGLTPFMVPMEPSGLGVPFPSEAVYEELRKEHQSAFDALLDSRKIPRDQGRMFTGVVADMLAEAARAQDIDLLVMGVMRRHGLERVLMGSSAERLAMHAPCDLLAIPAPDTGTRATQAKAA